MKDAEKTTREKIRASLSIDLNWRVALVLFEGQVEHEFRRHVAYLAQSFDLCLIYPLSGNSLNQFRSGIAPYLGFPWKLVDGAIQSIEEAADEIIAFRYDETLLSGRKVRVRILDQANRWVTHEMIGERK